MGHDNSLHVSWNWLLRSDPSELWPLVADTNRLFKNIGLPTVATAEIAYNKKSMHRQLTYNGLKYTDAWIEEPFAWEYPFRYGLKRRYKSGPFNTLNIEVDLRPDQKGTRLTYSIHADFKNRFLYYLHKIKFKVSLRRRLKEALKKYAVLTEKNQRPYQLYRSSHLGRREQKQLVRCCKKLYGTDCNEAILDLICDFLAHAEDIDLKQIHPKKLAQHWGTDRKETIHTFLYAVKQGILNFNWDICCPKCRKVQQRCKTLSEVHEPIYCSECESEFHINFNETLQLSFRPNPLIRKISEDPYCKGSPTHKPHVFIQQYLEPGEKRYVRCRLQQGTYVLSSPKSEGRSTFKVTEDGHNVLGIRLTEKGFTGSACICSEPDLVLQNQTETAQLFILEKAKWDPEILTAAEVTSMQIFRDMFSYEILKQGEKIAVDDLTFMFTDLYDSSGIYNKEGDSRATARVIEHFDILQKAISKNNGAIVKTIGDSVMAVFTNPADALRAFTFAQKKMSSNRNQKNALELKAGIHKGSCVAVHLNSRMDYFGCTVNLAARLVDMANENEIVISQKAASAASISKLLEGSLSKSTITTEETDLRSFDQQELSVKRVRPRSSIMRLVI